MLLTLVIHVPHINMLEIRQTRKKTTTCSLQVFFRTDFYLPLSCASFAPHHVIYDLLCSMAVVSEEFRFLQENDRLRTVGIETIRFYSFAAKLLLFVLIRRFFFY